MSLRWRWSLVVVLAAMVLGGLLPETVLDANHAPASMTTAVSVGQPAFPSGCSGSNCVRSTPAPATPVLAIAGLAALTGFVTGAGGGYRTRRASPRTRALPAGIPVSLYRPPQFSAFGLGAL